MPVISDETTYRLVHELFALRSCINPDPRVYQRLFRDISEEIESILTREDYHRSRQEEDECSKRLQARLAIYKRDENIPKLKSVKENLAKAMDHYVNAVETHALAGQGRAAVSVLEAKTKMEEARSALHELSTEFEALRKTVEIG
ncbi:hypothetical protein H2200_000025 [Cladophialophora chaetospira]|uniref:Uncharacterized protein n=1 Tax=Cladophialophora chaetospira TaxID=386627 RepID=A0AA38XMS9_9EURO|nr:hypothetical protein H2200_000025 [Cladophialophora chaetospira]